jgi:glycosyltransferase involved in cell wall biosynthesis
MSEPRLKVLMVASSYPRAVDDTASIFLRYLADSVARRGHEVQMLVPAESEGGVSVEGNVRVHRFRYLPAKWQKLAYGSGIMPNLRRAPWLWLEVPFFTAAMTAALLRLVRSERPDVMHAHWLLPQGLIALSAKYLCGVPVLATAHGADAFALQGAPARGLKRIVVSRSDAWTSNTRATAGAAGAELPEPHIVPMGVDVARFAGGARGRLRRELAENDLVLLFVGRLVEKKGCRDLLEAYALLPAPLRARTHLWIVGDGDEGAALRRRAVEIDGARSRFWGAIDHAELPDFYAAADITAVPSIAAESGDTEGLGVVILEAFAAGRCVVATRIGGIGEVVEDGRTGALVEPADPRQLARVLETLLSDEARRQSLGRAAAARAQDYSWDKIAAEFEVLYRRITARG